MTLHKFIDKYRHIAFNDDPRKRNNDHYLEIGVSSPSNWFDRIKVSNKVGVDPNTKDPTILKLTSDKFFNDNPDKQFDIIFIDGLHVDIQVTKDITNSLKSINKGGVIVMHDCNPPTKAHQREHPGDKCPNWTPERTGTTWRAYVNFRTTQDVKSCDTYVIDTDYGCGVIIPNHSGNILELSKPLTYDNLETNRKNG